MDVDNMRKLTRIRMTMDIPLLRNEAEIVMKGYKIVMTHLVTAPVSMVYTRILSMVAFVLMVHISMVHSSWREVIRLRTYDLLPLLD